MRYCENCGVQLQDESLTVCNECKSKKEKTESSITEKPNIQKESCLNKISKHSKSGSLILSLIGAVSGLISIILGLVIKGKFHGSYIFNETYGGDAYTGIQNAAARTANNVMYQTEIIKSGFSFALIIIGIVIICHFGIKFFKILDNK